MSRRCWIRGRGVLTGEPAADLGEADRQGVEHALGERAVELLVDELLRRAAEGLECGQRPADLALLGGGDPDHRQRESDGEEDAGDAGDEEQVGARSSTAFMVYTSTFTAFFIQKMPTVIMVRPTPHIIQPSVVLNSGAT